MSFVITTKNKKFNLPMEDAIVSDWINDSDNTKANIILDQINNERMLQPFFENAEDYVIIDFGANCGLFSLYVKDCAKRVIAVEPTPKTFNALNHFVAGRTNIETLQAAVSNTDGEISFFINDNPTINSLVNEVGEKITVQSYTFESIMKKFNLDHVDFVKCDIEGGEMLAFTDSTLAPVSDKIRTWAIEIHQTNANIGIPWPGNLESNRQQLAQLFQKHGYKTETIIHDQLLAWKNND
jgi:FkbM family methyltransferase